MKRFLFASCALALVLSAQVASAQRPGGGGFGGPFGGGAMMLTAPEVQKELNISEDQKTKLRDLMSELRPAGGGGNPRDLSAEERQKRVAEMQERLKKVEEKVSAILDDKQKARYEELRIQREGTSALARAEVAEKLALTAEQKEKIAKVQEEARAGAGGGGRNFQNLSQEERQKLQTEMRERREKMTASILAVLTPEQKEKFEKLQGAKFDFPAPNFGGGRQRNNDNN